MTDTAIEGASIRIGGREFRVAPLNFKRLKMLLPKIERFAASSQQVSGESLDLALEIVHVALSMTAPDLSREELEELLTLGDLPRVMPVIFGAAGMVPPGETTAAG